MESTTRLYRVQSKTLIVDADQTEKIRHVLTEHDENANAGATAAAQRMPGGAGGSEQLTLASEVNDTFPDGAVVEASFTVTDVPIAAQG